jgi:hypothetical protein
MGRRTARAAQVCVLLLLPLGLLGGLSACQTRLVGARSADYDLPRGSHSGIPFRLARPVFVLQQTTKKNAAGETLMDKWEIVIEYRSDPTAVYWVNVDPAEFHESDLTLSFSRVAADAKEDDLSSHGFLTSTKLTSADKSKDFFTALGQLASDVVGMYVLAKSNDRISDGEAAALAGATAAAQASASADVTVLLPMRNNAAVFGQEEAATLSLAANIAASAFGDAKPPSPFTDMKDAAMRLLTPSPMYEQRSVPCSHRALQEKLLRALTASVMTDIVMYKELTGIDLLPLYSLYVKFSKLGAFVEEALKRPILLPGATYPDFAALKARIVAASAISAAPPRKGGFVLKDYETAKAQALLNLLLQHSFLDALETPASTGAGPTGTRHSDEYLAVERRLFAARNLGSAWEERRRLRGFLETGDALYGPASPPAPGVGFVNEVCEAATRVLQIDGLIVAGLANIAMWSEPPTEVTEPDTTAEYEFDGAILKRQSLRWVYQDRITDAPMDRAAWLLEYLAQLEPGYEPEPAELVVLVERGYADLEVRPDGRYLGQIPDPDDLHRIAVTELKPCPASSRPGSPPCGPR